MGLLESQLSEDENRAAVERAWHVGPGFQLPCHSEMKENCKVFNTDW